MKKRQDLNNVVMFRCSKVVAKKANKFSCNSISERHIIQIGISLFMSDNVAGKKIFVIILISQIDCLIF